MAQVRSSLVTPPGPVGPLKPGAPVPWLPDVGLLKPYGFEGWSLMVGSFIT